MTISATLVRMMGGRLWVESQPGVGSTFHFTLTCDTADPRAMVAHDRLLAGLAPLVVDDNPTPPPSAIVPATAVRSLKILLAEDNVINQQVVVGFLTRRGHHVTVTNNGREALEAIARDTFDLVLMDIQMPEMSGFEATAAIRLRERETGGHLRIIAMTAHTMSGDRERCLAAGMDGYLPKPIDRDTFIAVVEQDGAPPAGAPDATPLNVFNREALLERLGGDEQLLAKIAGLFLEDCPARLTAIKAAVDARSAERIRTEAHALKGAAANLAVSELVEAARVLEQIGADGRVEAAGGAWERLAAEAMRAMEAVRNART